MATDGRLRYGTCWWCGEPDSLFRLEGARLAGSEELALPSTIQTPAERDAFRVCPKCATMFGYARIAHDAELFEAGIRTDSATLAEQRAIDDAARAVQRRVWNRIRKAIDEEQSR